MQRLLVSVLVLGLANVAIGCGSDLIPNTDVPNTQANRDAVDFVETYRHAVQDHNAGAILRLVSQTYLDDNGTPQTSDDIDYERLQEVLARWPEDVLDVRYEMRYRRVSIYAQRIYVDVTYTAGFKLRTAEGDRWERRLSDNRIELVRENGEFRITSGL